MTHSGSGAAAGAMAAAATIANAIKASGAIVNVQPSDFLAIAERADKPLIVIAPKTFWSSGYKYLTSYRGLIFYTKSADHLMLPGHAEIIAAQKIWIPG